MFRNICRLSTRYVSVSRFLHSAIIHNLSVETESNFPSINPATGKSLGNVSNCSENEALSAIQSAKDCFEVFKSSLHSSRANLLINWADLISANKEYLAKNVQKYAHF